MPENKDDLPNFDDLNFPVDELGSSEATEAAAESPLSGEDAGAPADLLSGVEEPTETAGEGKEPEAEKEAEPKESFFTRLAGANPYTVLLGLSLLALVLGVVMLLLEWRAYDFDTKAKSARPGAAAPMVQFTPPSTTAAA